MRKTPPITDGFEVGSRPQAKECKQSLETEKAEKWIFLEHPKKNTALLKP